MNSLDQLIDQLCPEGVELLPFGQVGEILRGSGVQKKDFVPEGKPALHYGQIYTHYGVSADRANKQVSLETYDRSKKALPGDVIIADASENDEDLAQGVAWLGDSDVALSNHTLVFRSPMDPVYVSYYLRTRSFDIQKRRYLQGTKVKGLSAAAFGKITIPVPPIEVQQEIVRILDQFTQLEAELEAELEKRRLQYAYYRDRLLSFDALDGGAQVRWTTLGEVSDIKTGARNSNEARHTGEYKFYTRGTTIQRHHEFDFTGPAVITAGDGVGVGKVVHFADGRYALHQRAYRIAPVGTDLNPKFLFFYLSAHLYDYLIQKSHHASVTSVRMPMLKEMPIPIPSLVEQQEVVSMLSSFSTMINDLSIGLPAEIAARRKQYEYYRDKLLTFEEKAS